jgi:hypothetical protein
VREQIPGLTDSDELLYVKPWARLALMSYAVEDWMRDGDHERIDAWVRIMETMRRYADWIGLSPRLMAGRLRTLICFARRSTMMATKERRNVTDSAGPCTTLAPRLDDGPAD